MAELESLGAASVKDACLLCTPAVHFWFWILNVLFFIESVCSWLHFLLCSALLSDDVLWNNDVRIASVPLKLCCQLSANVGCPVQGNLKCCHLCPAFCPGHRAVRCTWCVCVCRDLTTSTEIPMPVVSLNQVSSTNEASNGDRNSTPSCAAVCEFYRNVAHLKIWSKPGGVPVLSHHSDLILRSCCTNLGSCGGGTLVISNTLIYAGYTPKLSQLVMTLARIEPTLIYLQHERRVLR